MRLIASQHPRWAGLPVERVTSDGTTNAIYRLGPAAAARLPLVRYGEDATDVEGRCLARIAPHVPFNVPEQLAMGEPGEAWGLFSEASRAAFRDALRDEIGLDEALWARGRGHAVYHAAIYIPYYRLTNAFGVESARRQLAAVLSEPC